MHPIQRGLLLAGEQGGIVQFAQLADLRVGRRTVERYLSEGLWQRLDRSAVLTTPSPPSWEAYLWNALHRRTRIRHRALIKAVIQEAAGGVHSVLEHLYVDRVERPHGLPTGAPQKHPATDSGAVDKWYKEYGLVVELDGLKWHTEPFRDRAMDNANTRSGQSSLRYGSRELFGDPCGVAHEVGGILLQRTWPGPIIRCASCQ